MLEIRKTPEFETWMRSLADRRAQMKVTSRVFNMERGNFGDCKPVGSGVSEARIDCGPGYRLYFTRVGERVHLLLLGGSKATQTRDVARAKVLALEIRRGGLT